MRKRPNFNVPVNENVAAEFDAWDESTPGLRGDKLVGALKAIQAIYAIDEGLAFRLMEPRLSILDAKLLLIEKVAAFERNRVLHALTPDQQAYLVEIAKETTKRLSRK